MAGWLRKSKDEDAIHYVDPSEVEEMLPASVRHPEVNRFTPIGSDMPDDAPDGDLDFLTEIVGAVERENGARTALPVAKPGVNNGKVAQAPDTSLQLFHDMKAERTREARVTLNIQVADVDMSDLLEDLSTIAVALRSRKAA
jgi:hypothetical protein